MKQLYIFLLLAFTFQKVMSQPWLPMASDEQTSNSLAQTAASTVFAAVSTDGIPYISYIDDVGNGNNLGDFKNHAKRFINGQWNFAGDAISPAFPGSDFFPVALDGNVPYVAYNEAFNPVETRFKLSVRKLDSNTNRWEVVGQQGFSDADAGGAALAAAGGKIYIAYNDGAVGGKITVKFFDNANPANGWQTVGAPGISADFVVGINLVIDNGNPYVTYLDFGDNFAHIKKFNGNNWEALGTNNPAGELKVIIRSLKFDSHHTPFIAFAELITGAGVVRNLDTANAWVTTGNGLFATGIEEPVSLEILHDIPFIAFGKKQNGITQLNVKKCNGATSSWTDAGSQPITASPTEINTALLVTDNANKLIVTFRNLNGGIYAKTFEPTSILPVSLTSFSVTGQNNSTLLKWVTASEVNNKLFEIEHSTDAVIFKKIGEVTSKGSSTIQQQYNFLHPLPINGTNYYRLKQVNNDGNFSYSKIISVTLNMEQFIVILSPNPANNILHVANLTGAVKEIAIRNMEGKIMKQLKVTSASMDINIVDLPRGSYFISLYGDKIAATRSFIK